MKIICEVLKTQHALKKIKMFLIFKELYSIENTITEQ